MLKNPTIPGECFNCPYGNYLNETNHCIPDKPIDEKRYLSPSFILTLDPEIVKVSFLVKNEESIDDLDLYEDLK